MCRGYLVSAASDKVGDDIIIYDHERFPTLRSIDNEGFAQKELIPIEAAYAYIEAKNSLVLSGKDETFDKAIKQVGDAKSLVASREDIDATKAIDPNIIMTHLKPINRPHWPSILNPFLPRSFRGTLERKKVRSPLRVLK